MRSPNRLFVGAVTGVFQAALDDADPRDRQVGADKRKNQPFYEGEHPENPHFRRLQVSQPNRARLGQIDENFAQFFRGVG